MYCHKHKPYKLDDMLYNNNLKNQLKNLSSHKEVPNMLINGVSGSGKRTFCYAFLNEIYGDEVHNLNSTEIQEGTIIIKYLHSIHHIEIDLSIYNTTEKNIVINFIKDYVSTYNINTNSYKIIVFLNADKISIKFYHMLRRLIEKTMNTARYIFISRNLSSIPQPIQSRLLTFKTKVLKKEECYSVIKDICNKEDIPINTKEIDIILKNSINIKKYYDLYHIINFTQLAYLGEKKDFKEPVHKDHEELNKIIKIITSKVITEPKMLNIREIIASKYKECCPIKNILYYIHERLLDSKKISDEIKYSLIYLIADIEHKMKQGDKELIYIEQYIFNVIHLLNS